MTFSGKNYRLVVVPILSQPVLLCSVALLCLAFFLNLSVFVLLVFFIIYLDFLAIVERLNGSFKYVYVQARSQ